MKPQVSVLIVEPSEIICEGLRSILASAGGYNILSPLSEASLLETRLPSVRPDMLIVNPTLLASPRQQLAAFSRLCPSMSVVALVYQYVETDVLDAFGFLLDVRQSRSTLLSTLANAAASRRKSTTMVDDSDNYELSERETDILVLVAKGLSSKAIADRLNISVHTVNSHRKNITHKTGIKSVAGLAVYAMLHNLM